MADRLTQPAVDAPASEKTGRGWLWLICIVAIAIVAGFGIRRHRAQAAATSQPTENAKGRPVPILASPARKMDFPVYLDGLGNVTPLNTVTIKSRVDGQINQVAFTEGQMVKKGDLLIQIDPRPYQVQLDQANGQLAKDQAALKNSQVELDRDKQAADAIPKQTIDTQQATVDQNAGAVKIDEAAIESAQLQLTYAHITSPLDGRVGLRLVDQGNIVHASDTTGMAVITQLQPISVVFSLSQDDLVPVIQRSDRGVGLPVEAWDREFTTKLADGQIEAIDNAVDPTTGTIKLKATFKNEKNTLFPSQFVNARLLVKTLHDAILVPTAAVQRGPDYAFVYVVNGDKVQVRQVTPTYTEGDRTVIDKGLAAGEQVVTDGIDKLHDGSSISLRKASATQRSGGASTSQPSTQPGGAGGRHRSGGGE